MASRATQTIDITDVPELVRIAEAVRASGEPRILRRAGEDIAVVSPAKGAHRPHRGQRPRTEEDHQAFLDAGGGWKDLVDTDEFVADNYASRRRSSRPPVEL